MLKFDNFKEVMIFGQRHWKKIFIPLILILSILLVYKIYYIQNFAIVGADYGYYMSAGEQQFENQNLYSEVISPYPPLGILYYSAICAIGWSDPSSIFLINSILSFFILVLAIWGFGSKNIKEVVFFSLISVFAWYDFRSYDVKLELITTLFLSFSVVSYFRFQWLVFTGVFLALAVLTKQYALSYLAIFGLYNTIQKWKESNERFILKLFSPSNLRMAAGFFGTIILFFIVLWIFGRAEMFLKSNQNTIQNYGTRDWMKSINYYFINMNKSNYYLLILSLIACFFMEWKQFFKSKLFFIFLWLTIGGLHLYFKANKDYLVMPFLGAPFLFYFLYSRIGDFKLKFLFIFLLFSVIVYRNKSNAYYINRSSRESTMKIVDHFAYLNDSKSVMNLAMPYYSFGLHLGPQMNFSYSFVDNLTEERFNQKFQDCDSVLYDGYFESKGIFKMKGVKTRLETAGFAMVDSFENTALFVKKQH
jgi:hypothetical protein